VPWNALVWVGSSIVTSASLRSTLETGVLSPRSGPEILSTEEPHQGHSLVHGGLLRGNQMHSRWQAALSPSFLGSCWWQLRIVFKRLDFFFASERRGPEGLPHTGAS
jgi:hypothetical protein